MNFALTYIIYRFFYQFLAFFRHWYIDSFFALIHFLRATLGKLDRTIALSITLRHMFEPLYQDYTFIGYTLGFAFRSARALLGILIYGFIGTIAFAGYGIWCLVPLFLLYRLLTSP